MPTIEATGDPIKVVTEVTNGWTWVKVDGIFYDRREGQSVPPVVEPPVVEPPVVEPPVVEPPVVEPPVTNPPATWPVKVTPTAFEPTAEIVIDGSVSDPAAAFEAALQNSTRVVLDGVAIKATNWVMLKQDHLVIEGRNGASFAGGRPGESGLRVARTAGLIRVKNLRIGGGPAKDAVYFYPGTDGAELTLDGCEISGSGNGVFTAGSKNAKLFLKNCHFVDNGSMANATGGDTHHIYANALNIPVYSEGTYWGKLVNNKVEGNGIRTKAPLFLMYGDTMNMSGGSYSKLIDHSPEGGDFAAYGCAFNLTPGAVVSYAITPPRRPDDQGDMYFAGCVFTNTRTQGNEAVFTVNDENARQTVERSHWRDVTIKGFNRLCSDAKTVPANMENVTFD